MCIRGAWSSLHFPAAKVSIAVQIAEACIPPFYYFCINVLIGLNHTNDDSFLLTIIC